MTAVVLVEAFLVTLWANAAFPRWPMDVDVLGMASSVSAVRTRFAPSPTGDPHVGNLWNALFHWLHARHAGGQFIVRLEDTDRGRFVPGAEAKILEALRWSGLDYDEGPDVGGPYGPYRQSERLAIYQEYARQLLDSGAAYYCFCNADRLRELRHAQEARGERPGYDRRCRTLDPAAAVARRAAGEAAVVRLKVPRQGATAVDDLIRGRVSFQNEEVDDQVLLKSDGWPTYHLAAVVDDHLMAINPVVRGEEWLPSTPKHLLLYRAFGWTPPTFAHLPLILGPDRAKLSKRQGSLDILSLRDEGYLPDAVINYLALLGWNPKTEQELFTRTELIEQFNLQQVNRAGAIFDHQKLDWFNGRYLRAQPLAELAVLARPYLERAGLPVGSLEQSLLERVLAIGRERAKRLSDLPAQIGFFFQLPDYPPALLGWRRATPETTRARLERVRAVLSAILDDRFSEDYLEAELRAVIEREQLGVGETLWPLRVALSGLAKSPGPFAIASVLGKAETLARLERAIGKAAAL